MSVKKQTSHRDSSAPVFASFLVVCASFLVVFASFLVVFESFLAVFASFLAVTNFDLFEFDRAHNAHIIIVVCCYHQGPERGNTNPSGL